ncbi:hypothetical protein BD410DRAFT_840063 [Rickenella mellea]|uniref:Uncharacterized protein n=1 Tax=Rickenella mellea TaxID=50990 RepID=A0A4Y7Q428_9AGAM|nr:hypothetical protein BD410DRAFT_840063 [Rickenella mellea]
MTTLNEYVRSMIDKSPTYNRHHPSPQSHPSPSMTSRRVVTRPPFLSSASSSPPIPKLTWTPSPETDLGAEDTNDNRLTPSNLQRDSNSVYIDTLYTFFVGYCSRGVRCIVASQRRLFLRFLATLTFRFVVNFFDVARYAEGVSDTFSTIVASITIFRSFAPPESTVVPHADHQWP